MDTISKSIAKHIIGLGIICGMTISSCSREPRKTAINITNNSKNELNNVVVSGSGFSEKVGKMKISEQKSIFVRPNGESSVTITFNAKGKNYDSGKQGYFEPGYTSMSFQIPPNLKVQMDDTKISY